MGRKKRSSQNSNNVITNEDSSESESSKESTQGCEGNFVIIDLRCITLLSLFKKKFQTREIIVT